MRLGDFDALKDKFDLIASKSATSYSQSISITHIKRIIDNAPTVPLPDFKEGYKQAILDGQTNFKRQRDEWKFKPFDEETGISNSCWCPFCGMVKSQVYNNFCGNCGADLRGDGNDKQ